MTDLEEEILEVEKRVAGERAESLRAFDEYREHLRDQATSFTSLGVLVAVGFVAGTLLQRRSGPAHGSPAMGMASLLASALPVIARMRDHHRDRAIERRLFGRHGGASDEGGFLAVEESRGGAT